MDQQTLEQIAAAVQAAGFSAAGQSQVKAAFAPLRLTYCLLEELGAKEPVWECDDFGLFLVGSSDHCLGLTRDLSEATAVVVAEA